MRLVSMLVVVVLAALSSGCALCNIAVDPVPTGVQPGPARAGAVPTYDELSGHSPRAAIPFAAMGAHGNGYANRQYLKNELAKKAASMGADCVVIANAQINNGPVVTSYGNGTAISQQVQTMSVYGFACMYAPPHGWASNGTRTTRFLM
jgi:hypothetical protein